MSSGALIRMVGDLAGDFYFDNIRVRRAGTNLLGFESEELSINDWTSTSHDAGFYGANGKDGALFRFQQNRSTSHFGVSYSMASEGTRCFHIYRPGSNEVPFWLGKDYYTRVQNGETLLFDVYATNNGTAANYFGDGNRASFTGAILPVRQWNTISVTSSQITSDGRFLIIQSDAKGDFYLDNFRWAV